MEKSDRIKSVKTDAWGDDMISREHARSEKEVILKKRSMKEQEKRNRKKKSKRGRRRWDWCMMGLMIVSGLLVLYLGISVAALIDKTIEYASAEQAEQGNVNDGTLDDGQEHEDAENSNGGQEQENEENPEDMQTEGATVKSEYQKMLEKIETFASEHDVPMESYSQELIELAVKNPEMESFICNYPLKKDVYSGEPLDEYLQQAQVPLFLQWDSRWGYFVYGDKPMGVTGCGPTCLSMVALHLLQDPQMTPQYIAKFSQQNGFYVEGTGSAWSLMTQGAKELGLQVKEVSLDEDVVMRHLSQGRPIICAMGRGDFTENGHFIVFVGAEDGKIRVNDPNSRIRSEKLWRFEDIKDQIRNMWAYSVQ